MITLLRRLHSARTLFGSLLLLLGTVLLQVRFDAIAMEHFNARAPLHRFTMPAPAVHHLAFGFENVIADYNWVNAIQDINKWDHRDAFYPEYFRIISTLDPRFEYPYTFAILTIPSKRNTDSLRWTRDIAELGMKAFPENWEIPFYVGVQYHVIQKSYDDAVRYLRIAKEKKSAPEMVGNTYGIYLMHTATDYQKSRAFFETIYTTSTNEETKRIAKERIALLDFIETVEQAALAYKTKFGFYPNSLETLATKGFISIPIQLTQKFPLQISEETGKVLLTR